jgi:hypothetical protein
VRYTGVAPDRHRPWDTKIGWVTHNGEKLWQAAAEVLDANWAGDHTVPARSLYPHQWSWDAGFISIGLAHHAPERAWRDLRSLFEAQWPDGRVPHIVFDPGVSGRRYFPGPAFWEIPPRPNGRETTGVVQPPVHALAAWHIYQRTSLADPQTAGAELSWLYPRLVAQQSYLAERRDVGGGGLASIVHPWESGLDNSPAWDPALAAVPLDVDLLRRYRRRDVQVAVVEHRPTDADYARYIALAESYRAAGYRDAGLRERHPFLVECPTFNALAGAAERALAQIATVVGADPAPHRDRAAQITQALIDRLYDPATGMFHALDVRTGKLAAAHCVNGLIPLILPDLPAELFTALLAEASSPRFGLTEDLRLPVPSYDRTATDFDPLRYWRGPVWININWLLWRGLREHGRLALAAALRQRMLELIERSGCYEYFNPDTGAGIGSPAFSWTAALALDLLADPPASEER